MTEITPVSSRIPTASGHVPAKMLCMHRTDIPKKWWSQSVDEQSQLYGTFPVGDVIDMAKDVVGQLNRLFERRDCNELALPALEALSKEEARLTNDEGESDLNEEMADILNTFGLTGGGHTRQKHFFHKGHQVAASCRVLETCWMK